MITECNPNVRCKDVKSASNPIASAKSGKIAGVSATASSAEDFDSEPNQLLRAFLERAK